MKQSRQWPAQRWLLVLFIPLSLAMMLAMPLGRVPDEDSHLQRSYLLSTGQILSASEPFTEPQNLLTGMNTRSTTHTDWHRMRGESLAEKQIVSGAGFNTGVYPPNGYLPQAAAMALVRLFTNNRLAVLFAGRVGAWLVTVLLLYAAVRLLPAGKYALIAVTLTPMALQECMSASLDGQAMGAFMLLLAWVLHLREKDIRLTASQRWITLGLCVLTASVKLIYLPAVLLVCLLPKNTVSLRQRLLLMVIPVLLTAGWMLLCYQMYAAAQTAAEPGSTAAILPQVLDALNHPLTYAQTLLRTMIAYGRSWLHTMLGSALSAFNIPMPRIIVAMLGVLLLLIHLLDDAPELQLRHRGTLLLTSALCLLLMLSMLYAWWTPYRAPLIEGMQGRYLLPLVLPTLLALRKSLRITRRKLLLHGALTAITLLDLVCIASVLQQTLT